MKRILFYDNSVSDYFIKRNYTKLIIDYFDIEVQKILKSIGYSFKNNPQLILTNYDISNINVQFDFSCNIKMPILSKSFPEANCQLGVIFDCYS